MTKQGTVEPLPRGRHGLTREQVVQSQRERIFRAMAEVMAQKGYVATSVADVLRAAKVSRETFYEQFESKEDCFMSAHAAAVEVVMASAAAALHKGWAELLDRAFGRRTAADRFANEAIVAATSTMITSRLAAGDIKGIRALRRPLVELARRLHGA